jgi:hypothetical protein
MQMLKACLLFRYYRYHHHVVYLGIRYFFGHVITHAVRFQVLIEADAHAQCLAFLLLLRNHNATFLVIGNKERPRIRDHCCTARIAIS